MLDALWTRATIELEELKKFGVPAKVLKWRFQPRVSEKMKMLSIATDAAEVEVEMIGVAGRWLERQKCENVGDRYRQRLKVPLTR